METGAGNDPEFHEIAKMNSGRSFQESNFSESDYRYHLKTVDRYRYFGFRTDPRTPEPGKKRLIPGFRLDFFHGYV
jgi:hypothetical protein